MPLQKYRADAPSNQSDGSVAWHAKWMGGPSLSRINNCRLINLEGFMRATVYITGEPDTWFSIPAVCRIKGCRVTGYVTGHNDGSLVFRHCYY